MPACGEISGGLGSPSVQPRPGWRVVARRFRSGGCPGPGPRPAASRAAGQRGPATTCHHATLARLLRSRGVEGVLLWDMSRNGTGGGAHGRGGHGQHGWRAWNRYTGCMESLRTPTATPIVTWMDGFCCDTTAPIASSNSLAALCLPLPPLATFAQWAALAGWARLKIPTARRPSSALYASSRASKSGPWHWRAGWYR